MGINRYILDHPLMKDATTVTYTENEITALKREGQNLIIQNYFIKKVSIDTYSEESYTCFAISVSDIQEALNENNP